MVIESYNLVNGWTSEDLLLYIKIKESFKGNSIPDVVLDVLNLYKKGIEFNLKTWDVILEAVSDSKSTDSVVLFIDSINIAEVQNPLFNRILELAESYCSNRKSSYTDSEILYKLSEKHSLIKETSREIKFISSLLKILSRIPEHYHSQHMFLDVLSRDYVYNILRRASNMGQLSDDLSELKRRFREFVSSHKIDVKKYKKLNNLLKN